MINYSISTNEIKGTFISLKVSKTSVYDEIIFSVIKN